jgi:hypothetical protein
VERKGWKKETEPVMKMEGNRGEGNYWKKKKSVKILVCGNSKVTSF